MAPNPSANKDQSRYLSVRRWTFAAVSSLALILVIGFGTRPIRGFDIAPTVARRSGFSSSRLGFRPSPRGVMGLHSTLGITVRTVGRRSTRIRMIREAAKAASDKQTEAPTPKRKPTPKPTPTETETATGEAVTVTPSPGRTKSTPQSRKRKAPSTPAVAVPVASRRLPLGGSGKIKPAGTENDALELTTDAVAAINPSQDFIDLGVPPEELRPSNTLTTGQCFHWKVVHPSSTSASTSTSSSSDPKTEVSAWGTHDATEWVGVLRLRLFGVCHSAVVVVRELPETTLYRPLVVTPEEESENGEPPSPSETRDELDRALRDYFQLDVSLPGLYEEWSRACPRLATIGGCLPGVRIIRQDPWECLVSFLCSSNNNIPRITKMLASIRREYGRPLLAIHSGGGTGPSDDSSRGDDNDNDGDNDNDDYYYQFYSFPSLEELAARANDKDLRGTCGMGYRAGYLLETMAILRDKSGGGEAYLRDNLRNIRDPTEVQTLLCEFKGVGRKVADCVALFSLNQDDAIPVDTHVWNIAIRDYDPEGTLKTTVKSLTPSNYRRVGEIFRSRFPSRAGWAHSLLFVAELPSFRALLPESLTAEMDEFQKEEKERKKAEKEQKQAQKQEQQPKEAKTS